MFSTGAAAAVLTLLIAQLGSRCHAFLDQQQEYSGVYKPNTKFSTEFYAGAFLASKERFYSSMLNIPGLWNLEGASFSFLRDGSTLMTRDYFDFSVVHLSSTTSEWHVLKHNAMQQVLSTRMDRSIRALRFDVNNASESGGDPRLLDQTVCVIPFSTSPVSVAKSDVTVFQNEMRVKFLQATVLSVRRYVKNIIVTVGRKADLKLVKSANLPIWKVVDFSHHYTRGGEQGQGKVGHNHQQPKDSILFVYSNMLNGEGVWANFKYVYFTEGDHVLYLRSQKALMDAMDGVNKDIAFVPHRLQTVTIPQAFTGFPQASAAFEPKFVESMKSSTLVTEDTRAPVGSCCDNGRFVFAPCEGSQFWYQCPYRGRQNYTTWLRFGKAGFSFPTGTEHQARCTYSAQRRLCDVPSNCNKRVPNNLGEVCEEIPNVDYSGVTQ